MASPSASAASPSTAGFSLLGDLLSDDYLRISTEDPVFGGATDLAESNLVTPALVVGYRVSQRLSLETVIAPPRPMKMELHYPSQEFPLAELASIVPAFSGLPADQTFEVPTIKSEIGEIKLLGAIFSANYQFQVTPRIYPYMGLGLIYFKVRDTKLKSFYIIDLSKGKLDIDADIGTFYQIGVDYRINDNWSIMIDAKAISLDTKVRYSDVEYLEGFVPLEMLSDAAYDDISFDLELGGYIYQAGIKWSF